jgi:DNA polymerase III delta prime subunit
MHPWLQTLSAALDAEDHAARAEYDRLRGLPYPDQVEAGLRWCGIRLTDLTPDGRRFSAVVRGVLHDGIRVGDRIRVGDDGPIGRVVGRDVHGAEVQLREAPDPDTTTVVRLHDSSTSRRYQEALAHADAEPNAVTAALLDPAPLEPPTAPRSWPRLDASQAAAANAALDGPVALVHGPPGTGKTTVVTALLVDAVREGDRPWALADSNAAADHLARSARSAGLAVLRIGVAGRIDPGLQDATMDAWIARSPHAAALAGVERELARARSRREGGRVLGPLYDARRTLRDAARSWAWSSAEVLVSTHGSLAGRLAREPAPPAPRLAIVDEATQAVEPAIWVCAPHVERLVLVGDPHQLGPVVRDPSSALATSLLERLIAQRDAPMLATQYRMHADIHALVQHVYGDVYQPHPTVADCTLSDLPPVEFVDTAGSGDDEAVDPTSLSTYNLAEVALVRKALQRLQARGVEADRIAIATPYSAQVQRLAALPEASGCRVGSINALQGQEADAVLLSFVRSNPDGRIGFLNDERRLTVGTTRARRHLWMCGDSVTLGRHPLFADLLERCETLGALTSVWAPPWSD